MALITLPPLDPRSLAFIAGAGISLNAPSNLLDGGSFMRNVVIRVTPADVELDWALSALRLPDTPLRRPGEIARFEVLMHELVQNGLDPELSVLDCLDACEHPNFNHYLLAEMIRLGAVVITTNFDRLIELAWERLVGPDGPELAIAAFDADFPSAGPGPDTPPTLWKIHGSLSIHGQDTRASLQATLTAMLSTSMWTRKSRFLSAVLHARDTVVAGYSGMDDLDIIPVIANTRSERWLLWIEHSSQPSEWLDARTAAARSQAEYEDDAVGRDRVWFYVDGQGEPIRRPERIVCIPEPTGDVLRSLAASLPSRGRYPVQEGEFSFGARYPAQVQAYFDAWQHSLPRDLVPRYAWIAALHRERSFRPETAARLERIAETVRRLCARKPATPEATLHALVNEYNQGAGQERWLEMQKELEALADQLPPSANGLRLRLEACLAWVLEGEEAGARQFARTAAFSADQGDRVGELRTLTSWRSHAGIGWWGDAVPREVSARIEELASEIGYLPAVWEEEIHRYTDVIDENADLAAIHRRRARMHRYAIDVGDVAAEAILGLQIGRLYLLDGQAGRACEEFLRVRELNRLLNVDWIAKHADFFLDGCRQRIGPGYEARFTPPIRTSMWGGRDEPSEPAPSDPSPFSSRPAAPADGSP